MNMFLHHLLHCLWTKIENCSQSNPPLTLETETLGRAGSKLQIIVVRFGKICK